MKQITERDIEIINFINIFGFCEMPHLDKKFGFKKPRNYQVMRRLVQGGLIIHEQIFHQRHGVYRVSKKGGIYTDLPVLSYVPLAIYRHETMLIDLYFYLMRAYPEATWVSERELVFTQFKEGVGKRGHVADGMMYFPDGKKISIELELSLKGTSRLERILKGYATRMDIDEVWYFCSPKVERVVREAAEQKPFIKVWSVGEVLNAKS